MKHTLNFSLFNTNDFNYFGGALLSLFAIEEMSNGILKNLVQKLSDTQTVFKNGQQKGRKNPYTNELKLKDAECGRTFNRLKYYIKSFAYSANEQEVAAANKVIDCIKKYGWNAADMRYGKKTFALNMVLSQCNDKHSAEIALLNTHSHLADMQLAFDAFEQTQMKRLSAKATRVPTATATRAELIDLLRKIIQTIDIEVEVNQEESMKATARKVDRLIMKTMSTLKARNTRKKNKQKTKADAVVSLGESI